MFLLNGLYLTWKFIPQFNHVKYKRFAALTLDMWYNVGSSALTCAIMLPSSIDITQ